MTALCYDRAVLWRRCLTLLMAALHYGGAALWGLYSGAALSRRCTMMAPYTYGGAPVWRRCTMAAANYGRAVLCRRVLMAAPYYGRHCTVVAPPHYGGAADSGTASALL